MNTPPQITYTAVEDGTLLVNLSGPWRSADRLPDIEDMKIKVYASGEVRRVALEDGGITVWDSGLPIYLVKVKEWCDKEGVELDVSGLPEGARGLLRLATAVPERKGARREAVKKSFIERVGEFVMQSGQSSKGTLTFLGETVIAAGVFLRGRAQYLKADLFLYIQEAGASALGIVTLISFLVGIIIAFIGAVQLALFGAAIYTADLVGIAMVRALGPIMTGIVLAGRTGASYAAQLGTMQVNEEIDALRTLGISPMEFLVMPRMIALILMTPLLCLYADLMGILGGALVGIVLFDITPAEYFYQTKAAIPMHHVWVGLFQGAVYGVLIAVAGCMKGMQCGRSAWEVGSAATSAVVTSITWIIIWCAILTMLFNQLGI
jgi:phospholipid/cholesterol/gamma-HCH transport system permease protein